jgi:hypothetical protein
MAEKRKKRRREIPEAVRALQEAKQAQAPAPAAAVEEAPAAPAKPANRGQFQSVEAVIAPDMRAYDFMREWWKARQRGDYDFMFALSTEDGPLREHFGDREAFPEVCKRKMRPVSGIEVGELRRIRFEGADEAHVFQVYGHTERENRKYTAERLLLLATDAGWRIHAVDQVELERSIPVTDVGATHFGPVTLPAWFTDRRAATKA